MIKLISDRLTHDLPCCRSVIFFPAGVLPVGKKMTLRQRGRSCAIHHLSDFHGNRGIPTFVQSLNTLHTCFVCPYLSLTPTTDLLQMHRTRASTSVLARVLYIRNPVPSLPGHLGHERAHRAHSCPVCPYLGFFGRPEHRRAH